MTENEKLRALLAEARGWVGGWSGILPVSAAAIDSLRQRIDVALAEPMARLNPYSAAVAEMRGDAWQKQAMQRERERDEARAEVEGLRKLLDAQAAIIAEMRTPAEDRVSALEMELAEARAEVERLRRIVSACASAIGNGAFASPECSLDFMAGIPAEIAAEMRRGREAYRRGAEAMRETAALGLDRLLTKKNATAIWVAPDEIRALPLPEDKP